MKIIVLDDFEKIFSELFWGCSVIALFLLGLSIYLRRSMKSAEEKFVFVFPWFALFLLLIGGLVTGRNIFFARYFEFLTVPFILLIVLLLKYLSKNLRILVALVLIASGAWSLPKAYIVTKAPWKDAANYIAQSPGAVYTMRTLALQTPYFTERSLEVLPFENIDLLLNQQRPFYLIETYYQGMSLFPIVQEKLKNAEIHSEMLQFQRENSDIVLVLKVDKN